MLVAMPFVSFNNLFLDFNFATSSNADRPKEHAYNKIGDISGLSRNTLFENQGGPGTV